MQISYVSALIVIGRIVGLSNGWPFATDAIGYHLY
jgi:hypothetical protein